MYCNIGLLLHYNLLLILTKIIVVSQSRCYWLIRTFSHGYYISKYFVKRYFSKLKKVLCVCSSTNKCTKPIYYINILLHNCTYFMLWHVSKSVRHHQGAHLFLPKITCMTSVVIDYKRGKIHKIVRHKIHECNIYNS